MFIGKGPDAVRGQVTANENAALSNRMRLNSRFRIRWRRPRMQMRDFLTSHLLSAEREFSVIALVS